LRNARNTLLDSLFITIRCHTHNLKHRETKDKRPYCNLADFPELSNSSPLSHQSTAKRKAIAGIFPIKLSDKLLTHGQSLFQV
jgi:UDP-2,3-diacylglucosamine pyrophosphatase LpxH